MTDPDFDPEACAEAVAADPALQAAVDEIEADAEQFKQHLAGQTPLAARRAAVESAAAKASPTIADRLRRILLHPAAGQHWPEAQALTWDLDIPVDTAVAGLNALAGTGGGRTAN